LAGLVGKKLATQEIFGNWNNCRLAGRGVDRSLLGNTFDVKAGYVVLGNDFALTENPCHGRPRDTPGHDGFGPRFGMPGQHDFGLTVID
jgi:hypothetical protein